MTRNSYSAKAALVLVAVLCMALVACTDDALVKVSKALNDTALATGAVETTLIQANAAGAVSEDDTRTVLTLCLKIEDANKQAVAVTRGLVKLTPAQRGDLTLIIKPILDAVTQAINSGVITIKDQGVRTKVLASLATVQVALTTINVIVSGSGSGA